MKNKVVAVIATSALVAPMFVFATSQIETRAIEVTQTIGKLIQYLIPITFGIAVIYFFWGLANYILNAGDDEKKKAGRAVMLNGIIALFVMVSIYGIINVLGNFTGATNTAGNAPQITLPRVTQ